MADTPTNQAGIISPTNVEQPAATASAATTAAPTASPTVATEETAPAPTTATPTESTISPTATTLSPSATTTDKGAKRQSMVKNLMNKIRPGNKKKESSQSSTTSDKVAHELSAAAVAQPGTDYSAPTGTTVEGQSPVGTTTTTAQSMSTAPPPAVETPHPGTIIPHGKKTGDAPVKPAHVAKHGKILTEVDVLVTKEAEKVMEAMSAMVENSGRKTKHGDVPLTHHETLYPHAAASHTMGTPNAKWLSGWATATVDKLFASHHMGVYVITNRESGEKVFESMPVFTRLGMHLLFVSVNHEVLDSKVVDKLFADVSIRQGKIYDNVDPTFVQPHIEEFIKTYQIPLNQLLEPDLKKYKTVNDFFKRSLKPDARPVIDANDLSIITSPADSRMTVFSSISAAKKFWIKGQQFTLPLLLDDKHFAETFGKNPSIAIFRLAPQDYHRFHAPFKARLGRLLHVPGTYYTVNPQAINEDLNVFTANRRDVQALLADLGGEEPATFGFVAVGAMLVGSIGWSKSPGEDVLKGEDMGFFQYGGSTTILIAPEGTVEWDADLIKNSENSTETLVKVGERIGKATITPPKGA